MTRTWLPDETRFSGPRGDKVFRPAWRGGRFSVRVVTVAMLLLGGIAGGYSSEAAEPSRTPKPVEALPSVLDATDVARYRSIRGAQAAGDWNTADLVLGALKDRRLVGDMLADRYLSPDYKAEFRELSDWLSTYPDAPNAGEIRALAARKRPRGAVLPPAGRVAAMAPSMDDDDAAWRDLPMFATDGSGNRDEAALRSAVRGAARARKFDVAIGKILAAESDGKIAAPVIDELRGELGAFLFANGDDSAALAISGPGIRSAARAPNASWIAGLAAWRLGRKTVALEQFTAAADSTASGPCAAAAAAYWAARARLVTGQFNGYDQLLSRAAASPYCFYGLIARRARGLDLAFDWRAPPVDVAARELMTADPRLARALALIEVGDRARAEDELRRAIAALPPTALPVVLAIAERGGLPAVAMGVASRLARGGGPRYDAGLFPLPPWSPPTGFTVNRALVYAIARVESHFQTKVVSAAGAVGLMQLMPETARAVAPRPGSKAAKAILARQGLLDPSINLGLGQRYIDALLNADPVRDNLLHLATAYNSGPGALAKWREQARDVEDPLMFVEGLPVGETRLFVQRVMTYMWIYQSRLGQPATSLDALAEGRWPVYSGRGEDRVEVAERNAGN